MGGFADEQGVRCDLLSKSSGGWRCLWWCVVIKKGGVREPGKVIRDSGVLMGGFGGSSRLISVSLTSAFRISL